MHEWMPNFSYTPLLSHSYYRGEKISERQIPDDFSKGTSAFSVVTEEL
jgi:hypothetical protein